MEKYYHIGSLVKAIRENTKYPRGLPRSLLSNLFSTSKVLETPVRHSLFGVKVEDLGFRGFRRQVALSGIPNDERTLSQTTLDTSCQAHASYSLNS